MISKGLVIPNEYKTKLDLMHTQIAIKEIKDDFENELSASTKLNSCIGSINSR